MSPITTHILDTARGRPAAGIVVRLEIEVDGDFKPLATGTTNADGRVTDLLPESHQLKSAVYQLHFEVGHYFQNHGDAPGESSFYPSVPVIFRVDDPSQHYHVPLLLSPYGYSTYRGS